MQESDSVDERFPFLEVRNIEVVLVVLGKRPFESGSDALRGFVGEFDGALQQRDGEERVRLHRNPDSHRFVRTFAGEGEIQQFLHKFKTQMAILEQDPSSFNSVEKTDFYNSTLY